jgi:siderophore synthetase component
VDGGLLRVTLADGSELTGDAATARAFAEPEAGFTVTHSGRGAFNAPGDLVRALGPALGPHAVRLADELDNSVANLALARHAQPPPDGGAPMLDRAIAQPDPLVYFEQSVVDGHPLHPCARTRIGLDPDEVRAYAPEHHPTVRLRRVAVPVDRWCGVNSPPILLMHPWQHDRLRDEHPWLSRVDAELPAHPLMSLRTLARGPDHIKTAMDVQMTSAVRTVSPDSVHNGYQISRLMTGIGDRVPGLAVLPERGGSVIVNGAPDRRLSMVWRRMPGLAPGEFAMPLAALCAPTPATGAPLVAEIADRGYGGEPLALVAGLASVLLPPVFGWLDLGVALEAHGQNVLGVLRAGRLHRVLYRDFGGVRVSRARLRAHGVEPPPLRGDIPSDDPEVLRTKVLASAVSTVLGEVVATLGRLGLDESQAWDRIAAVAGRLPGSEGLFGPSLPLKAMTAMRLAEQPTVDIWCSVGNPMAGAKDRAGLR